MNAQRDLDRLYDELRGIDRALRKVIAQVHIEHKRAVELRNASGPAEGLLDDNGRPVLADALAARGQVIAAMVSIRLQQHGQPATHPATWTAQVGTSRPAPPTPTSLGFTTPSTNRRSH